MIIGITGASGQLGRYLVEELSKEHDVISIGGNGIHWRLGLIPNPIEFSTIEYLIHLAWSTKSRVDDFHLNVGGTQTLLKFAQLASIPSLFISSVAVKSNSCYGHSKNMAEDVARKNSASVLRIGLVPSFNKYENRSHHLLSIIPQTSHKINLTFHSDLLMAIQVFLNDPITSRPVTRQVISGHISLREYFASSARYHVSIPLACLVFLLGIFRWANRRIENYWDAAVSLQTTPTMPIGVSVEN